MSDLVDMFETSDGHTIAVRVLNGTTIEIRKFNRDGELVARERWSGAQVRRVLASKRTEPRTAWSVGERLTMAPPDVDRTAEALNSALANLS